MSMATSVSLNYEGLDMGTWFFSTVVTRLEDRGDLTKKPSPPDAKCFYGNPLRNWALDLGDNMTVQTDLCRDWELVANPYSVWEYLALNGALDEERMDKFLQQLVSLQKGRVFQWVTLYEWISKDLLNGNRYAVPEKRPYSKMLLLAYISVFERIRQGLNLSDEDLEKYRPVGQHSKREENIKVKEVYFWKEAPPYAAMILTTWSRIYKGDEGRGTQLMDEYKEAAQNGSLVETPGGLVGLPKGLVGLPKNGTPKTRSIPDRLETAMAVDRYVYMNPGCYGDIDTKKWTEAMDVLLVNGNAPDQPSEQLAEKMGLDCLNLSGIKASATNGATNRFVPTASVEVDPAIQICNCTLSLDKDEPVISLCVELPLDYPDDVYDMMVVILTEAKVDGKVQFDTCFGHVDYVEVEVKDKHLQVTLDLRPTYASHSLLYQLQRSVLKPTAQALVMPVEMSGDSRMVIGVHVVLGPLVQT